MGLKGAWENQDYLHAFSEFGLFPRMHLVLLRPVMTLRG